jgi:hypothetical protein
MIELRENGVLISNVSGCIIELLRYSEISSVSVSYGTATCPPFDLTLICTDGWRQSVPMSEFGNAHDDYDGVMAKANQFMVDLMDRCAGAKIGTNMQKLQQELDVANKVISSLANLATRMIGMKDDGIFEPGMSTATPFIDRLKTELGVANSRLEAAREEGEERRVEVAELKSALAESERERKRLQDCYDIQSRELLKVNTALQRVIRDLRGL